MLFLTKTLKYKHMNWKCFNGNQNQFKLKYYYYSSMNNSIILVCN